MEPKNYFLECNGGRSLNGLTKTNFSATFRTGKDIIQRNVGFSFPRTLPENSIPLDRIKVLRKTLNNPGLESTYVISFTPLRQDIDILGCIYVR